MVTIVELIQTYPHGGIVVIAGFVSLFISLINYIVLDKEKVKNGRVRQKELQKQMKEHKHDTNKMMELNKEFMQHTMDNFKHSFKPMIITIIPVLVVFYWIRGIFEATAIAGSWLWWYIGSAVVFSLVFRKLFKLP
jgi:uncharacterized membrane protein (DUF106 family)